MYVLLEEPLVVVEVYTSLAVELLLERSLDHFFLQADAFLVVIHDPKTGRVVEHRVVMLLLYLLVQQI